MKLIVCNGAKICIEDESRGIIVDSSPPTPGQFQLSNKIKFHRNYVKLSKYLDTVFIN